MPGQRILVVDADELVRWGVERELSAHDMRVRAVADAACARTCLRLCAYDLALVDMDLPDEDGLSLAVELRAAHPEIAVFLMGCDVASETRDRAYAAGAAQCVDKPFELERLVNLARSTLGEFPQRRRQSRFACAIPLSFAVLEPSGDEAGYALDNLEAESIDVSDGGLGMRTSYPTHVGRRVSVRPREGDCRCTKLIVAGGEAEVVWVDRAAGTTGLCYTRQVTPDRTS